MVHTFHDPSLAAPLGDLSLSPDDRHLYVLWDGLHDLQPISDQVQRTLQLPVFPQYTRRRRTSRRS